MDPEKKEETSKDFGNIIDALHSKQKLPSLRTYQGDMAEFIKEKNESVFSIAVKEKKRKEEEEKEEKKMEEEAKTEAKTGIETGIKMEGKKEIFHKPKKKGYQMNIIVIFSSLLLVALGVFASLYVFKFINKENPVSPVVIETEIVPYNNSISLLNATKENFGQEMANLSFSNGVSVIKISDAGGKTFDKAKDLFNFLQILLPGSLERTLKDRYMIGAISQNKETFPFIVITVNDFGNAFSAMLEWETNIEKDLSFLNAKPVIITASTTASSTLQVKPVKQGPFEWKDVIVKNKDIRGLINQKNQAEIAYTFLDKNTILITNSLSAIGEISSIYASRSVVR
jgi:hypothetical protein